MGANNVSGPEHRCILVDRCILVGVLVRDAQS